jgi:hypothetical protein
MSKYLTALLFVLVVLFVACAPVTVEESAEPVGTAAEGDALAAVTPTAKPVATVDEPLVTTSVPEVVEPNSAETGPAPEANSADVPVKPDMLAEIATPFDLPYADTALVESNELFITFAEVIEDSRCPKNVQCMWEGAVEVELTLIQAGKTPVTGTLRLVGGIQQSSGELLPGYTFNLLQVEPYPVDGNDIDLQSYVITLDITTRAIKPIES